MLFAAACALAHYLVVQQHLRVERPVVRGAILAGDAVDRCFAGNALAQLLIFGLVIMHARHVRNRHHSLDQPARLFHRAVQIHRAQQRLHRVGENRGLFAPAAMLFAMAEQQVFAEIQPSGRDLERPFLHAARAQARQLALRQIGVLMIQPDAGTQLQHRIAQEFQPLVVNVRLPRIGRMGHRQLQQ